MSSSSHILLKRFLLGARIGRYAPFRTGTATTTTTASQSSLWPTPAARFHSTAPDTTTTAQPNIRHAVASSSSFSDAVSLPLPKRHSKDTLPPTCVSAVELDTWTQELLTAKPGSLYKYHQQTNNSTQSSSSTMEDAWKTADATVQKAEYLLRGHAAQIPNTLWNHVLRHKDIFSVHTDTNSDEKLPSVEERIQIMHAIVKRLETEGALYMELRKQVNSQLSLERNGSDSSDSDSSDSNSDSDNDSDTATTLVKNNSPPATITITDFAAPGPTVAMYDVLLDAMALDTTTHKDTPMTVFGILQTLTDRHLQDGGDPGLGGDGKKSTKDDHRNNNLNAFTVPTQLSFNAVLRAVANTPFEQQQQQNEKLRDEAITVAMNTLDFMRMHVSRNSATYTYMLQTIAKYLPPSQSRGNIAYAMFTYAKMDNVIDQHILDSLLQSFTPEDGSKFEEIQKNFGEKELSELPWKWKRYSKVRRYRQRNGAY